MDTFKDDVDEVGTILKLMIDNILKKKNQEFREMKEAFAVMKESPLFQKMFLPEKIVEENESLKNQLLGLEAELKSYRSEESINIHLKVEDIGSVDTEYEFDRKYKGVDNVISNKSVEVNDLAEASASEAEAEVDQTEASEADQTEEIEEEASASEADEAETEVEEDAEDAEEAEDEEVEVTEGEEADEADEVEAETEADEVEESEQVETEASEADEAETGEETEASEAGEETEEEEEVIEIEYNGITYFVTNETDGEVYECVDDDIGEQVGVIKKGKITIF